MLIDLYQVILTDSNGRVLEITNHTDQKSAVLDFVNGIEILDSFVSDEAVGKAVREREFVTEERTLSLVESRVNVSKI